MSKWTSAAAIAGAASQPRKRRMCLHCRLRRGFNRGLCEPCYNDPYIRSQYPCRSSANPVVERCAACRVWNAIQGGLCYTCLVPPCPHGRGCGECAVCEAQQRATMGLRREEELTDA